MDWGYSFVEVVVDREEEDVVENVGGSVLGYVEDIFAP